MKLPLLQMASTFKPNFTKIVAIDFSGSAIKITVKPNIDYDIETYDHGRIFIYTGISNSCCPTALLMDPKGDLEAMGNDALEKYYGLNMRKLAYPNKSESYSLFNCFIIRQCLIDDEVQLINNVYVFDSVYHY